MIKITRKFPLRYTKAYRERNGAHGAFEAECREQGYDPRVATTITTEAGLVYRDRSMWADDVPVQRAVSVIWSPTDTSSADTGVGGIASLTEQSSWEEEVRSALTTDAEVEFFGYAGPVYVIMHKGYALGSDEPVERTTCVLPCDRWTLEYAGW